MTNTTITIAEKIAAVVRPTQAQLQVILDDAKVKAPIYAEDLVAITQGFIAPGYANLKIAKAMGYGEGIDHAVIIDIANTHLLSVSTLMSDMMAGKYQAEETAETLLLMYGSLAQGFGIAVTPEEALAYTTLETPVQETVVHTNENNGGNNMNQQIEVTPEVLQASVQAGTMTLEQAMQVMATLQQPQQQSNTLVNLATTTATAAGNMVVGGVTAVTDLITSLAGVGAEAIGSITNTQGVDLKAKLQTTASKTLDTTHVVMGGVIDTTAVVSTQAVKLGVTVGTVAIDTAATVSKQLLQAGEEIATTLIAGVSTSAHTVNNGFHATGKKAIGLPLEQGPTQDEMNALMAKYGLR